MLTELSTNILLTWNPLHLLQVTRDGGSDASDQENEAPDVTMETEEPPAKKGKLGTKGKKGPKVRN